MASENERWLGHFDLILHAVNQPNNRFDLSEAFKILAGPKVAGSADVVETDTRWILQLTAVKIMGHAAVFFFLGIDKERAASIYANMKTFDLRTIRKLEDEGVAVSAHLAVSMTPNKSSGAYTAVLEDVEGLSRSKLIPYLRRLINKYVVHSEIEANGNEKTVAVNLASAITLDKPISDQLNEAKLLAVQLVRKASPRLIDRANEYYEKTKLIEFRPTRSAKGPFARGIVTKILGSKEISEYPVIRIRVEEGDGRERTVNMNRSKGTDPLTAAFQLRTLITGIKPPLKEATKEIIPHFAAKMIKSLK